MEFDVCVWGGGGGHFYENLSRKQKFGENRVKMPDTLYEDLSTFFLSPV